MYVSAWCDLCERVERNKTAEAAAAAILTELAAFELKPWLRRMNRKHAEC